MTDEFFSRAYALIVPFEGCISHMYLDTRGLVTVGIGNLLAGIPTAQQLNFILRGTNQSATPAEIANDFMNVSAETPGLKASSYKLFTRLDLTQSAIDNLFHNRVTGFITSLNKAYVDYSYFPESVQLAILDMAFNLGVAGLRNKWPKLNAAIAVKDWATCAANCIRPGGQQVRNDSTVKLFLEGVGA